MSLVEGRMEQTAFIIIGGGALLLGLTLQIIFLGLGVRIMRFADHSLKRVLRVGGLLILGDFVIAAASAAFKMLGAPSLLIELAGGFLILCFNIIVLKRTYETSIARALGALAIMLIAGLVYIVPLRAYVLQAFKVQSATMIPTIQIDDHILASKYAYLSSDPKRGDIVVFVYPIDSSKSFIKRVIALPGEDVEIRDKRVFVDGSPINDPWGNWVDPTTIPSGSGEKAKRDNFPRVKVPPYCYFVMGDNRDRSYDSRFWGFLPTDKLVGKVLLRYWPLVRIGTVN